MDFRGARSNASLAILFTVAMAGASATAIAAILRADGHPRLERTIPLDAQRIEAQRRLRERIIPWTQPSPEPAHKSVRG